jgi:hypothetical protein
MEEDDLTWGFCMMLTDDSQAGRESVDRTTENLLRLQERCASAISPIFGVSAFGTTRIAFVHTNSDTTYAWCLTPARSRC